MKIFCVGRNYADHANELKNEIPAAPVIFMKPETALLRENTPFYYPEFSKEIHFEVELVVKINREGKNVEAKFAHKYYQEVGIGIDFTARDLQNELKAKGLPWEIAKAFNGSAALGGFTPLTQFKDIQNINIELRQNGTVKQQGNTQSMLFQVNTIIAYISTFFTLKMGDLIYTGTPAGVGPVKIGDVLECYLEGEKKFECKIL